MNIFIIPSWSATIKAPHAGCFFLDQAKALAKTFPSWNIAYCSIDTYAYKLSRNINENIRFFQKICFQKKIQFLQHSDNLFEYRIWYPRIFLMKATSLDLFKHFTYCAETALNSFQKRCNSIELIHVHSCLPAGYAAMNLSQKYKMPYVLTEHMNPFPWPCFTKKDGSPISEIEPIFRNASSVIAVSKSLGKEIQDLKMATEIHCIPNVVDTTFFKKSDTIFTTKRTEIRYLCICSIEESKGIDLLLEAYSKLTFPSVLSIVGDGSKKRQLQQQSSRTQKKNKVLWLGKKAHSEIPALLQNCDIFVLPSRRETFGCVYAEAIACGKPIIATKCGGPEDIVTKDNGVLIPTNDVDALVKAMEFMAQHFSDYNKNIIAEDAVKRFSQQAISMQLEQVFNDAIKKYKINKEY